MAESNVLGVTGVCDSVELEDDEKFFMDKAFSPVLSKTCTFKISVGGASSVVAKGRNLVQRVKPFHLPLFFSCQIEGS